MLVLPLEHQIWKEGLDSFWAVSCSRLQQDKNIQLWQEKEIKSFVKLSVKPGSRDIIRRRASRGGLPQGHAATLGGFPSVTVHNRGSAEKKAAPVWD